MKMLYEKKWFLIIACLASTLSAWSRNVVIDESFNRELEPQIWSVNGPKVANGQLIMNAESPKVTGYVNAMIVGVQAHREINFMENPVIITLEDLNIDGTAPLDRQSFMLVIGSDQASESIAAGFVRLCVNGDGQISMSVLSKNAAGKSEAKTIKSVYASLPIKKLEVTLDPDGYLLLVEGAAGPVRIKGTWGHYIEPSVWKNSFPYLTLKSVRRPSGGSSKVVLGGLKVETE